MNSDELSTFKDEVIEAVKDFDKEQIVRLAFVCGVRALPIIGHKRNFSFWKEEKRQVNLYALFCALDYSYAFSNRNSSRATSSSAVGDAAYAAAAAVGVAAAVGDATADAATCDDSAAAYAAAAVGNAAYAATDAAYFASDAAYVDAAAYADAAAFAYAAFADAAYFADAFILNYDIKKVIQDDIITIGANKQIEQTDTAVYGEVWDSFIRVLIEGGCGYWADLYQELFRNHFEFDQKELTRRLGIWDQYKDFGASAAGEHLLSTRKASNVKIVKEARIILIGKAGAGKTSLAKKLVDENADMPGQRDETHGVDTTVLSLGDVEAHLWDFGGQAVIYSAHKCFLASRCVYIIVCDGRTEGTEEAVIAKDFENIKYYGGQSKVFVVVNKYSGHKVNFNEQFFKEQYKDMYDRYYEIDIQEDKDALRKFKADLEAYIIGKPTWGNEINTKFYEVQEQLKSRFQKGEDFISLESIQNLADDVHIKHKDFPILLKELHIIGTGFHYEKLQNFETIVLNPTWISHGVYTVIRWLYDNRKKVLKLSDFDRIFANTYKEKDKRKKYPPHKDQYIFDLMKEFKLGCSLSKNEMIVPCTLDAVSENDSSMIKGKDCISLKVTSDVQLPDNFMPQLITCLYEDLKAEYSHPNVWRNAFLYADDKVHVLAFMNHLLGNAIEISVWGEQAELYAGRVSRILKETYEECCNKNPAEKIDIKYDQYYMPMAMIKKLAESNVPEFMRTAERNQYVFNVFMRDVNQALIGDNPTVSTNFSIHYSQAVQELLPQLSILADVLAENSEGQAYKEVKKAIDALEQNKECKSEEEAAKSGVFKTVGDLLMQLGDPKSAPSKAITGLEKAGKIGKTAFNMGRKVATVLIPALMKAGEFFLRYQGIIG
jgi:GTPase SAR1 family protein